jgi:hypothetical protein
MVVSAVVVDVMAARLRRDQKSCDEDDRERQRRRNDDDRCFHPCISTRAHAIVRSQDIIGAQGKRVGL